MTKHLFAHYNEIFPKYWNEPALTDYNGDVDYTFAQVAEQVARLREYFQAMGIRQGDKIALCGRNCANWAVSYLAIASYGAVIVSVLHEFSGEDIETLINHSEARMLFVGPYLWKNMQAEHMPGLDAIVSLTDFSIIATKRAEVAVSEASVTVPQNNHIFTVRDLDDLLLINYTSGSTGSPKGVMLTYRNVSANVDTGLEFLPPGGRQNVVSMLPLAHMYGQLAEFLYPLASGCHIHFLTKSPTPTLLMKAFADVKPYIIVTVPLVIEKICKRAVMPVLEKPSVKKVLKIPVIRDMAVNTIRKKLMKAFGGQLKYFIVGGAAINPEVEDLLLKVKFPLVVGYGMTECGPLIGGCYVHEFVPRSG
ncbi:MAG: AMP-binding protein, partial [Bacteroidales bacterium]|nr:AMP-binding protein [Bacteroidales bacterium]